MPFPDTTARDTERTEDDGNEGKDKAGPPRGPCTLRSRRAGRQTRPSWAGPAAAWAAQAAAADSRRRPWPCLSPPSRPHHYQAPATRAGCCRGRLTRLQRATTSAPHPRRCRCRWRCRKPGWRRRTRRRYSASAARAGPRSHPVPAGAGAGAENAAPRSKSELLPPAADDAGAGAPPPRDKLARSSSGLVDAAPAAGADGCGVPGAGAEKASSSSKSMRDTCFACERALAPGWPDASLRNASTESGPSGCREREGGSGDWTHAGSMSAVAVRSPALNASYRLRIWLMRSLMRRRRSARAVQRGVREHVVRGDRGREKDREARTHRVGVVLCRVGDPLLQLGLDVPALLRDLLCRRILRVSCSVCP